MRTSGAEWYVSFYFSKLLFWKALLLKHWSQSPPPSELRCIGSCFCLFFLGFFIFLGSFLILNKQWTCSRHARCLRAYAIFKSLEKKKKSPACQEDWHGDSLVPLTSSAHVLGLHCFFWHNECFVGLVCLFWRRGGRIQHTTCGYNDIAPSELHAFTGKLTFHCFKNSLRCYFTDVAVLHSADISSWAKS